MKFCDFRCLSNSHALKEAGSDYWRFFSKVYASKSAHLNPHDSYLASCIAAVSTLLRMGQVEVHEMSRCRLDPGVGIFRDRTSRHTSTHQETRALYHVLRCACTSTILIRSKCIPICTPRRSRRVRPAPPSTSHSAHHLHLHARTLHPSRRASLSTLVLREFSL